MSGLTEQEYKEIHEGLDKINGMSIDIALLKQAIVGNGAKGLKQQVDELQNSVKELQNEKPKSPKMAWKQIVATLLTYITIAGFIWGTISWNLTEVTTKLSTLDQRLHEHILKTP